MILYDLIVLKKSVENKNILMKWIMWILKGMDIVLDFMEMELNSDKIYCLANFLKISNYKEDIEFVAKDNYVIMKLSVNNYIIIISLDSIMTIEYIINSEDDDSQINYKFDVVKSNGKQTNNIIFKNLKPELDDIINRRIYKLCKSYILK